MVDRRIPKELFGFELTAIHIAMESLVCDHLPLEKIKEFQRFLRLQQLFQNTMENGWNEFSWQRLHDEGQTCLNDYTVFAEELNGLDPGEYSRKRAEQRNKT